MLPALNIPTLVSPLCPSLPHTFPSTTAKQRHKRYHLPWGLFKNSFSFVVSLPLPFRLPITLSVLCCRPFPLPILCSLLFPGPFLNTWNVLLTLAIVIIIAIARTTPPTARRSAIRLVLTIIIVVNYLIPIQWSNGKEVAWLVLPKAWWLNRCPEIIATVPREMFASAFNIP